MYFVLEAGLFTEGHRGNPGFPLKYSTELGVLDESRIVSHLRDGHFRVQQQGLGMIQPFAQQIVLGRDAGCFLKQMAEALVTVPGHAGNDSPEIFAENARPYN